MSLLEEITANGKQRLVTGAIAGVILLVAVVAIVREVIGPSTPKAPTQAWFYDLNTGKLFPGPIDAIPPIPAPSGPLPDGQPAGARAYVYTCKTCSAADRVITFVETCSPEVQAQLVQQQHSPTGLFYDTGMALNQGVGVFLKRPGDTQWIEEVKPEAIMLRIEELNKICPPGKYGKQCFPTGS